jgi:hypothetical protein
MALRLLTTEGNRSPSSQNLSAVSSLGTFSSLYIQRTLHFATGLMCVPLGEEVSKWGGLSRRNRDRTQEAELVCWGNRLQCGHRCLTHTSALKMEAAGLSETSEPICMTSHPKSQGSELFHYVVLIAWSLCILDLKIHSNENEGHVTGLLIGKAHSLQANTLLLTR